MNIKYSKSLCTSLWHYECALQKSVLSATVACGRTDLLFRVDFAWQTGRSQSWDEDNLSVRLSSDLYMETVWKVKKRWWLDWWLDNKNMLVLTASIHMQTKVFIVDLTFFSSSYKIIFTDNLCCGTFLVRKNKWFEEMKSHCSNQSLCFEELI